MNSPYHERLQAIREENERIKGKRVVLFELWEFGEKETYWIFFE